MSNEYILGRDLYYAQEFSALCKCGARVLIKVVSNEELIRKMVFDPHYAREFCGLSTVQESSTPYTNLEQLMKIVHITFYCLMNLIHN